MRFRSTQNIFSDLGEVFDPNWMDSNSLILPPNPEWDYSRPLQIEDIDIWEVLWEAGGGWGVYASWCPYAEFYMLTIGAEKDEGKKIETFYGPKSQEALLKRTKELNIELYIYKIWVDKEDMWLYKDPEPKSNTLILP